MDNAGKWAYSKIFIKVSADSNYFYFTIEDDVSYCKKRIGVK